MYKMNSLILFIFTLLTLTIVIIADNRIILWLLLVILTFYNLHKNKKVSFFIDLILVLLLGLSKDNEMYLIMFKLIYILNFIITIYNYVLSNNLLFLINRKRSTKLNYYNDNFEKIVEKINNKKKELYDDDVSIDDRIEKELERSYLQSRIRYYSLYKKNKCYNWNRIDTLVLLFILVVFIILFILR